MRAGTIKATPLLQSSLAVSTNDKDWYLVNAGPDVRIQIESFAELHAGPQIRETPLSGIILTDAEFDHTIGLLSLREGSHFTIYGTQAVHDCLQSHFPVFPMLKNYCSWEWHSLYPESPQRVGSKYGTEEGMMTVEVVPVSKKPPLYVQAQKEDSEREDIWEVGLVFRNEGNGKSLAYFPTLAALTPAIEKVLRSVDILMVDGTFWSEDELVKMGVTERGAYQMGHMPIGGREGTMERLADYPAERKILIHINNSNPILREDSIERQTMERLGFEIAFDGMELEV